MAKHVPYVPEKTDMKELTFKAVLLGIVMAVVLGAANAYLGLKAGVTVAAAFPAAVVAMAVLRIFKGSILEENIARTTASVGEALVAGAIFTIPGFVIAGIWKEFGTVGHYLETTAIMMVGGILGVLFVTLLRRTMVEEATLPFPESVAAAEIHKAGRSGGTGAKLLLGAMTVGALTEIFAKLHLFAHSWEKFIHFSKSAVTFVTSRNNIVTQIPGGGGFMASTPAISPAYLGVGYIIGSRLASIVFAGGILGWALFIPLLMYFTGPELEALVGTMPDGIGTTPLGWEALTYHVWKSMVRPIAVGGMVVGAAYTLWKMRKQLFGGIARSFTDVKKAAESGEAQSRLDKDINFKVIFPLVGIFLILMAALYYYYCGSTAGALISAMILGVAGFFFAAVAGYLVGLIGSSNNPVSGLTLSTLIIAALLMVAVGVTGAAGVAAALGVAAVVCCSSAVAGDMLQDMKVGHILGGTPWKMEVGEIIGVIFAGAVLFLPLLVLHQGDINAGGTGFGGKALPAPQAGLMAMLAKGIITGKMAWPLLMTGAFMSVALILIGAPSPMLIAVGMYLPIHTTFAIFTGGVIKYIIEAIAKRKKLNEPQKIRVDNAGILIASGFIAGEALLGLVIAALAFFHITMPHIFATPAAWTGYIVLLILAIIMIKVPLSKAGRPDEAAPPSAMG
ncbi:MAG: oligopeptide transporter, OPT family [Deltaproteobacteria bacterium]|jgi:putative OPT family oligopeptide transporter|nr:oligopeptide transporter, OPT family [Deltaproteobacteria bacterium]